MGTQNEWEQNECADASFVLSVWREKASDLMAIICSVYSNDAHRINNNIVSPRKLTVYFTLRSLFFFLKERRSEQN